LGNKLPNNLPLRRLRVAPCGHHAAYALDKLLLSATAGVRLQHCHDLPSFLSLDALMKVSAQRAEPVPKLNLFGCERPQPSTG
jgi:hypothetical protein